MEEVFGDGFGWKEKNAGPSIVRIIENVVAVRCASYMRMHHRDENAQHGDGFARSQLVRLQQAVDRTPGVNEIGHHLLVYAVHMGPFARHHLGQPCATKELLCVCIESFLGDTAGVHSFPGMEGRECTARNVIVPVPGPIRVGVVNGVVLPPCFCVACIRWIWNPSV